MPNTYFSSVLAIDLYRLMKYVHLTRVLTVFLVYGIN